MGPDESFLVHCRRSSLDGPEQVILNQNEEARKSSYIEIGQLKMSPDHAWLAYTIDTRGDETYAVRVRHLPSGREHDCDTIDGVYSIEWACDGSLLYTVPDALRRPSQVRRHELGRPASTDRLLFAEPDHAFFVDLRCTKDKAYVTINCNSKTSSEVLLLDAADPTGRPPQLVQRRQPGIEYYVERLPGRFVLVTNADGSVNRRVLSATSLSAGNNWQTLIEHDPHVRIEDMDFFQNYFVAYENARGLSQIRVYAATADDAGRLGSSHLVQLPFDIVQIHPGLNAEFSSETLRFSYSTPLHQQVVCDYDMRLRRLTVLRDDHIAGTPTFDPANYVCRRVMVPNGEVCVPMTLMHPAALQLNGRNPVLMKAYGAYGQGTETHFRRELLPLLQRGWVVALAHVRGGGEMGADWYRQGRQLNKANSFADYFACADYLIEHGYSQPSLMSAWTSSAGALLSGVAVNRRPELFRAIVAKVPFVDVLTSILDDTLPLTIHEYEEWGNPHEAGVVPYVLSYDPYANVVALGESRGQQPQPQPRPSLYVTGALLDPRVPYWQPAKWVAKLRAAWSGSVDTRSKILLEVSAEHGHFGDGGRHGSLEEQARVLAFLLHEVTPRAAR